MAAYMAKKFQREVTLTAQVLNVKFSSTTLIHDSAKEKILRN